MLMIKLNDKEKQQNEQKFKYDVSMITWVENHSTHYDLDVSEVSAEDLIWQTWPLPLSTSQMAVIKKITMPSVQN